MLAIVVVVPMHVDEYEITDGEAVLEEEKNLLRPVLQGYCRQSQTLQKLQAARYKIRPSVVASRFSKDTALVCRTGKGSAI